MSAADSFLGRPYEFSDHDFRNYATVDLAPSSAQQRRDTRVETDWSVSLMKDFRASNHKAPGLAPRMLIVYRAVDTIIRCWETLTGGSAGHDMSGRSLDELAREAEAANAP